MNNVKIFMSGPKAEVWCFARNGQVQVLDYLKGIPGNLADRFRSQWVRFVHEGLPTVIDRHRLAPLQHPGKGLWAFKQFDARIYGTFVPNGSDGRRRFVLLSGWTKDKTSSIEEDRQIIRAQRLRAACLSLDWSSVSSSPFDPELPSPATASEPEPVETTSPPEPVETTSPPESVLEADVPTQVSELEYPGRVGVLTLTDLTALCDVPYSTLRGWIRQGRLPAPTVPAAKQGTFGWTWSEADALFVKTTELHSHRSRNPLAAPRLEVAPSQPTPPPPSVASPPQEAESVLSRGDLVAMAARVIDGDDDGDVFLRLVRRRLDRIGELEKVRNELSRLLGGEVS